MYVYPYSRSIYVYTEASLYTHTCVYRVYKNQIESYNKE